jgi:nitrilase
LIAFPEVFVPGTPIWIDAQRIWDGDATWYAMLVDQAVVVPGPVADRLGQAARDAGVYLVVGIEEREPHGATIYNSVLYFGPDGALLGKHRKLVPTGSERTVWGMGDGSTLQTYLTPFGHIGGLTCWENYMPLARFFVYSEGVELVAGDTRRPPTETQVGEPWRHQTGAPVRPAEPGSQPGWLLASLGGLAAALTLAGGLAVLAARRAGRRARVGHAA